MARLEVTAAVAVLPTVDGREQYLYKGAIVDSEPFTEKGLEHARAQGLIGDAPEPVEEEPPAVTQADVDAAAALVAEEAQKVADAKADLDRGREAFAAEKAEFDAARAESAKKPASAAKAPTKS